MRLVSQEFPATERRKIVSESIRGLLSVQRQRPLNRLENAALQALQRIERHTVQLRNCVISNKTIARPVAVARRAMEITPWLQ